MLWSSIWPSGSSEDREVMFGHFHHWENWNKQHRFLCTYQEKVCPYFWKGKKTVRLNVWNQKVAIRADRETFARLLLIQQKRKVNLKEVLTYELGPLPLSISNYDGTLRKTQKSKLFQHLKSSIVTCVTIPENCPQIFDGMVLLQKLPKILKTFGDISDYILKKLIHGSTRVAFFVTDYYLEDSIKSIERDSRSAYGTIRMKVMRRQQVIQKQWKKFLQNSENWPWLIFSGMIGRQIWNTVIT